MDEIEKIIVAFENKTVDRFWAVSQLEDIPGRRILKLFMSVLASPEEDPELKIEILKSLVVRNDSELDKQLIGSVVLKVFTDDHDTVVRQFAANSLRHYVGVSGVLNRLEETVKDESEDIDVRHNALTAIEFNRLLPICQDSLRRLIEVPELGLSAKRTLDSI